MGWGLKSFTSWFPIFLNAHIFTSVAFITRLRPKNLKFPKKGGQSFPISFAQQTCQSNNKGKVRDAGFATSSFFYRKFTNKDKANLHPQDRHSTTPPGRWGPRLSLVRGAAASCAAVLHYRLLLLMSLSVIPIIASYIINPSTSTVIA